MKLRSLELFAGAGGLALGIHDGGFKCLGLIERDTCAVETLRDNSKRSLGLSPRLVINKDVRDPAIDYGRYSGEVSLLSGGPPCQPFSTAGLNKGHKDDRNMFPAFIDVLAVVMPKAFLIENVKGLLRPKFQTYYSYLLKRLECPLHRPRKNETWRDHLERISSAKQSCFDLDQQYEVDFQLVDASDFGVPQRRQRVIVTGFRRDTGRSPVKLKSTHSRASLLVDQWVTGRYWDRHKVRPRKDHLLKSDFPLIEKLKQGLIPSEETSTKPWVTVRDAISDLDEAVPRGSEPNIPNHVQHPGARIYPCHIGSFWDFPSKALKAGTNGTPGGENVLRYSPVEGNESVRYFTTREAARLHTFPDTWLFHGTWGACIRQLGNAVPVKLARLYAEEILADL